MLAEDRDDFVAFAQTHASVAVVLRDAQSSKVEPIVDLNVVDGKVLCLWNRQLTTCLERKWISKPGYYRVDGLHTPTLEFVPSFKARWQGKPALGQGRLLGDFDSYLGKPAEFNKWYEALVRWLRKNYRKNPVGIDGYVGPAAYKFYAEGAYLLPNFLPPRTKVWIEQIGKQHFGPKASTPTQRSRRISNTV